MIVYLGIALLVIVGIILAVLGALGYLTPKHPSPKSPPAFSGGTTGDLNTVQTTDIQPMWGPCIKGGATSFDGVEYRLQTVCEAPTCSVRVDATYVYPDGTTDVTSRTFGNSGWYHNPPTNPMKLPVSATLHVFADSVPQGTYNLAITPPSC
jgi:hypothetical protein